ncbi:hypothetical protein R5R35_006472 [Gryllus longicercus]|uniref:Uncharacterized protein n=1 Tax=Gryllus longicercus TaxID=2509291 RepID=A0AAN9VS17_9ORTH
MSKSLLRQNRQGISLEPFGQRIFRCGSQLHLLQHQTRPKKKICRLHSLTAGLSNLTSSEQMAETQQGRKQEEAP